MDKESIQTTTEFRIANKAEHMKKGHDSYHMSELFNSSVSRGVNEESVIKNG